MLHLRIGTRDRAGAQVAMLPDGKARDRFLGNRRGRGKHWLLADAKRKKRLPKVVQGRISSVNGVCVVARTLGVI
jgi:hypothetical protein